jgi:hypothetical protein
MNVEIGAEAALFPEKEYISRIFVTVHPPSYSFFDGFFALFSSLGIIYLLFFPSYPFPLPFSPLLRVWCGSPTATPYSAPSPLPPSPPLEGNRNSHYHWLGKLPSILYAANLRDKCTVYIYIVERTREK